LRRCPPRGRGRPRCCCHCRRCPRGGGGGGGGGSRCPRGGGSRRPCGGCGCLRCAWEDAGALHAPLAVGIVEHGRVNLAVARAHWRASDIGCGGRGCCCTCGCSGCGGAGRGSGGSCSTRRCGGGGSCGGPTCCGRRTCAWEDGGERPLAAHSLDDILDKVLSAEGKVVGCKADVRCGGPACDDEKLIEVDLDAHAKGKDLGARVVEESGCRLDALRIL
jgi:hypothetical protein